MQEFRHKHACLFFIATLCLIIIALACIRLISSEFISTDSFSHPYKLFVACLWGAGIAWVGCLFFLQIFKDNCQHKLVFIGFIACIAIGLRLLFISTHPIYENDWHRYLWDGMVVAEGVNPYAYSPQEINEAHVHSEDTLQRLHALSKAHDYPTQRIAYADLTSIYPPFAQIVFALSAFISPLNLDVLRLIFLAIDIIAFFCLYQALRAWQQNPLWSVLYMLNPLAIYAGFNAVHMDILLAPFLLFALWMAGRLRTVLLSKNEVPVHVFSILFLSFATLLASIGASLIKVWPLFLLGIFLKPLRQHPLYYFLLTLGLISVTLSLSVLVFHWQSQNNGLINYMRDWQRSGFVFSALQSFFTLLFSLFNGYSFEKFALASDSARIVSALVWLGVVFKLSMLNTHTKDNKLPFYALFITALLFLLSPTAYPWYYIWVLLFLPFISASPQFFYGLALLSPFLSLHYLSFALHQQEHADIYELIIMPSIYIFPLLGIVIYQRITSYKSKNRHAFNG